MPELPLEPEENVDPRSDCPVCKKAVRADSPTYPFCCARCRTIDLGRWLDEDYVISRPIEQSDLDEE
ncbi:DNA gyrase inhibitor YacG [Phycisphaerales bacterium AB-hyl4]|uniref:DNA gyrase inhibitor YacG n=1 Tax=Natronomicrosphaera hydrolytica TaxID=3242702 RepID=A0ABV4U462_9BACT